MSTVGLLHFRLKMPKAKAPAWRGLSPLCIQVVRGRTPFCCSRQPGLGPVPRQCSWPLTPTDPAANRNFLTAMGCMPENTEHTVPWLWTPFSVSGSCCIFKGETSELSIQVRSQSGVHWPQSFKHWSFDICYFCQELSVTVSGLQFKGWLCHGVQLGVAD